MADETSEDKKTKARAAFLDSPVMDELMKTLNKLKGFTGTEDVEPGEADTESDAPPAEEVEYNNSTVVFILISVLISEYIIAVSTVQQQ